MNDVTKEAVQELKRVDGANHSQEPPRRRPGEGGLNLKPSGRVPGPTSLDHKFGQADAHPVRTV